MQITWGNENQFIEFIQLSDHNIVSAKYCSTPPLTYVQSDVFSSAFRRHRQIHCETDQNTCYTF